MSKQILPKELAEIVTVLLTNPSSVGELDTLKSYEGFMLQIGEAVAQFCGGDINGINSPIGRPEPVRPDADDDSVPMLSVSPNDSLPSVDQNIWSKYDPEGWEGEVIERNASASA